MPNLNNISLPTEATTMQSHPKHTTINTTTSPTHLIHKGIMR